MNWDLQLSKINKIIGNLERPIIDEIIKTKEKLKIVKKNFFEKKELKINWPYKNAILSNKDKKNISFK